MRPTLILHADWSANANKRWVARAHVGVDGRCAASAAIRVDSYSPSLSQMIPAILREIGDDDCAVVGFDFPIGVPRAYAEKADIRSFRDFLLELANGKHPKFAEIATCASDICIDRPFYPARPGGARHEHLVRALGVTGFDELRRRCELPHEGRKAACPIFWTLGANQVGRAALNGWCEVLAPVLQDHADRVLLWPFDGPLNQLTGPGRLVVAETYPAEYYRRLFPGGLKGKAKLPHRAAVASELLAWCRDANVEVDSSLEQQIMAGFQSDDAFDAVVGLLGMVSVLWGQPPALPPGLQCDPVEGWILGQANLPLRAVNGSSPAPL